MSDPKSLDILSDGSAKHILRPAFACVILHMPSFSLLTALVTMIKQVKPSTQHSQYIHSL